MGQKISKSYFRSNHVVTSLNETEEEDSNEPNFEKTIRNINDIIDNPGFSHITEKILWPLDHKTCLSSGFVSKSWKKHFDNPL